MFLNILKKDLKRKKVMNVILLIFIILCTTFLASSVNNMVTTLSALDYFEEKTNGADYYLFSFEKESVEEWVKTSDQVKVYEHSDFVVLNPSQLKLPSKEKFISGGTISLAKLGTNFNRILGSNNEPITSLKAGEISLCNDSAKKNKLKIGDTITIKIGDKEKALKLTQIVKDMAFGTAYMGISKFTVSDEDFDFFKNAQDVVIGNTFMMETPDVNKLEKEINRQSFSMFADFSKDTVRFCYTLDMMTASILIVVSISLILIALVVLRFSIGFTIQEDFREIGIMKAIGIRNRGIKGLYIIKYFAISVVGAIVGVFISFPFGNLLLKNIQNNIAMESSSGNIWINILCGLVTVLLVVGFCFLSASKVNKFTAIQAVRNGSSGERFKHKSPIKLHKRKKLGTVFFMALNDIFSSFKSFCVLIITFILGTLMVILPINSANTLTSDDYVTFFGMTKSDVYINNNKADFYCAKGGLNYSQKDIKDLKEFYHNNGVDMDLHAQYLYRVKIYTDSIDESINSSGTHCPGIDAKEFNYISGNAPKLENELAMTEIAMEKVGVHIGDTVNVCMGSNTESYIITASYQSMMNMGNGIRFSQTAKTDFKNISGILPFEGTFKDRADIDGQIQKIKKLSPQYTIHNTSEYLSQYLSGIVDSIDNIKWMLLVVVLLINYLITILMARTLMTKDIGEIALLKNIGFTDGSIKLWQALRIIIVLAISIFMGVLLSNPLNGVMAKYTFGLMGASSIEMTIVPFEIYFLYPLILFIGTTLAVLLSTKAVNRINLREVNNME